ncbi:dual specificity protein phosphatase 26 isoform X1 [Athene noctua]|uniref:dual specificity protein phosphatase 26 isoform X1 n=1 Tax=Athene noctua TaxID=126797 RepID=UPI003EB81936
MFIHQPFHSSGGSSRKTWPTGSDYNAHFELRNHSPRKGCCVPGPSESEAGSRPDAVWCHMESSTCLGVFPPQSWWFAQTWPPFIASDSRFSRNGTRSPSRSSRDERSNHPILSVFELERLLYTGKTACNHADEVWPGLYLGDQDIAANRRELAHLRITHILNASHSKWRGGAEYYEGTGIRYLGIEAHDSPSFDMSPYFYPAADFIHQALNEGRILVHCAVGVSRSATLVLAYLMIRHHMPLVEAIKTVKDHRGIIPNRGFLRQLVALDNALRLKRSA